MSGVWVAIGLGSLMLGEQYQAQQNQQAAMKQQRRALNKQQLADKTAKADAETQAAAAAGAQRATAKRAIIQNALELGAPTQTLGGSGGMS